MRRQSSATFSVLRFRLNMGMSPATIEPTHAQGGLSRVGSTVGIAATSSKVAVRGLGILELLLGLRRSDVGGTAYTGGDLAGAVFQ